MTQTSILHQASGRYLAIRLRHADTFFRRLGGLLVLPRLQQGEGLLITPCQQIHTHFMRYSIDVLFLDKELKVIRTQTMPPWRMSKFIRQAHHVLELPAGGGVGVNPEDQLQLL